MLSKIVFLVFLCGFCAARYCIHNEKGWCRGNKLWGWCFHNKTSGDFNCDDSGFCGSQDQLKNRRSSGCFVRANSSVCCCNDADGCNLGFIGVAPKYAHGQQCSNSIEVPNEDPKIFRNCDDPYCYSLLSAEEDGGMTTAIRGCHTRKLVMHHMAKDEHTTHANNTKWRETEQLARLPNCAQVLRGEPAINGTTRLCVDFVFEQRADEHEEHEEEEVVKMKGRLCCCAGTARCNEEAMWADEGIRLEELEEKLKKEKNSTSISGIFNFSFSLILVFSRCL